jgi:hypothetical protein
MQYTIFRTIVIRLFVVSMMLFFCLQNLNAQQIDAGIFKSAIQEKVVDVKMKPDFTINANQTVSGITFTIRWDDPSIEIVDIDYVFPYTVQPFYPVVLYEGYYYLSFGSVPGAPVGSAIQPGQEVRISSFTFDGPPCVAFELITDVAWTQNNNSNLYFELGGVDKTGIIYEDFAPFYENATCPGEALTMDCDDDPLELDFATPPGGVYAGEHITYNSVTGQFFFVPDCDDPGTFTITYTYDDMGCVSDCEFAIEVIDWPPFPPGNRDAIVKVFLQGLYDAEQGEMNQTHDHDGSNAYPRFQGKVAEKILIVLHKSVSPYEIVTSGWVNLNQNGQAAFSLPFDYNQSYYIAIQTRNHLETWSAAPVSFAGTNLVEYDFTDAADKAYGDNMVQLETGVWGIYAGDVDRDGVIDLSDREPINDDYLITKRGYFPNDINGDGIIDLSDREIVNDSYLQTITKKIPE